MKPECAIEYVTGVCYISSRDLVLGNAELGNEKVLTDLAKPIRTAD